MRTFTHDGQEWMVEPAGSGNRDRMRVRFVSTGTPRLEAFGHVAGDLDRLAEPELSKSLQAALADQSLG